MIDFPFTSLVRALPASIPFVGPEALERRYGHVFKARVGANESAFGLSPRAREAMRTAIDGTAWYCDPENADLRGALGRRYGFSPDWISVGAGIDDLLGLAVRVFLSHGDVTVASRGSYPTFHYHVAGFGAISHGVPYREDRIDLDGLAEAVRRTGSPLVYLANPDNPTGTWHAAADVRAFLDALPAGCMCILDEAYFEFAPEDALLPIHPHDDRVIRMRTFSKAHGMAGARIGYAIAHPEVVAAFDKIRLHFNVNRTAQVGALASLADGDFILQVVSEVARGRCEYAALGQALGISTLPSAANFVAFDFGAAPRAQAVLDALIQRGVFVRKPSQPPIDRLVRVTVGRPEERAVFAQALTEVWRETVR